VFRWFELHRRLQNGSERIIVIYLMGSTALPTPPPCDISREGSPLVRCLVLC
jgi:hypothetical protein